MAQDRRSPISIRVEKSVLQWFKAKQPKGYQSLMQSVLRDYVQQQQFARALAAGRAQELFRRYYAQCFWHYDKNLKITPANMELVIEGLRKFGGREGLLLADELCQ